MTQGVVQRATNAAIEAIRPKAAGWLEDAENWLTGLVVAVIAGVMMLIAVVGLCIALAIWLRESMGAAGAIATAALMPIVVALVLGAVAARRLSTGIRNQRAHASAYVAAPVAGAEERTNSPPGVVRQPVSVSDHLMDVATEYPMLTASAVFAALGVLGPRRMLRAFGRATTMASLVGMLTRSAKAAEAGPVRS